MTCLVRLPVAARRRSCLHLCHGGRSLAVRTLVSGEPRTCRAGGCHRAWPPLTVMTTFPVLCRVSTYLVASPGRHAKPSGPGTCGPSHCEPSASRSAPQSPAGPAETRAETDRGPMPPSARRCTRRRRLTVCPVAQNNTTTRPPPRSAIGPSPGARGSDSTEGPHGTSPRSAPAAARHRQSPRAGHSASARHGGLPASKATRRRGNAPQRPARRAWRETPYWA
jgi:hypothetical protein